MITVTQNVPTDTATLTKIWEWLNDPRTPNYDDFNPGDKGLEIVALREHLENRRTFGAMLDGELIGLICFLPTNPVSGWFQGMVMSPVIRGKGVGQVFLSAVVTLLTFEGFKTLTAAIFVDNTHMQYVFKKCGAIKTGYIPQTTMRDGKLIGHRLFSFCSESVIITQGEVA